MLVFPNTTPPLRCGVPTHHQLCKNDMWTSNSFANQNQQCPTASSMPAVFLRGQPHSQACQARLHDWLGVWPFTRCSHRDIAGTVARRRIRTLDLTSMAEEADV